ncbi:hypothetical protein [Nocardiopsis sp. HUAS JQ3]|uniref:hypothetical protein n=1 Tax=Nocardiopsis sp. HUAS JQ3 TaxID=3061629 RepID=UPI0023A9B95E|nr:hypothetical protein [Nocardiopsis sp. HUAS JQ3]WDZ88750.1 hypothetical protein PV789_17445 [Nocardiopsis sp. HUAS JQ3]
MRKPPRTVAAVSAAVGAALAVAGGYLVYDARPREDPAEALLRAAAAVEASPGLVVRITRTPAGGGDEGADADAVHQVWPEGATRFTVRYTAVSGALSIEPEDADLGYGLIVNGDGPFLHVEPGGSAAVEELLTDAGPRERAALFPAEDYGPRLLSGLLTSLAADPDLTRAPSGSAPRTDADAGPVLEGDLAAWDLDLGRVLPREGTGRVELTGDGLPARVEFTVPGARLELEPTLLDRPADLPVPRTAASGRSADGTGPWWPDRTEQLVTPVCGRVGEEGGQWWVVTVSWTMPCARAVPVASTLLTARPRLTPGTEEFFSAPVGVGGMACRWATVGGASWRPHGCTGPGSAAFELRSW